MTNGTGANLGFEDKLWAAADKLRGTMDAAEYKHVVLGLIFLKYISDAFMEMHERLADDEHKDLRSDFILANPPFNMEDWGYSKAANDVRWRYGAPPKGGERKRKDGSVITVDGGNANYAWIQHFLHHLAPDGTAGFVLANGSMSSNTSGEGEIRGAIIEADLVDCMIALPGQLFYTTPIPVCLWFLTRQKTANHAKGYRSRIGETLFIDARKLGALVDRTHRELSDEDIAQITRAYHAWRSEKGEESRAKYGEHEDQPGFCGTATLKEIKEHGYVLTPGRYVGTEAVEDDLPAPRPGCFFVYAIRCDDDSIYIGHTDNLSRRWDEHKKGHGADWTKAHKPVRIVHNEESAAREEAVAREKELKTTNGRRWLKEEIAAGRARQAGGIPFEEKMAELTAALYEQMAESIQLDDAIRANMEALGYGE